MVMFILSASALIAQSLCLPGSCCNAQVTVVPGSFHTVYYSEYELADQLVRLLVVDPAACVMVM